MYQVILLFCICALLAITVQADSSGMQLKAETWEASRAGEQLIKLDELTTIINSWSANPQLLIEIRYPGGEEGELWSEELKGWLVSLGVPSASMQVLPGSDAADIININLIKALHNP